MKPTRGLHRTALDQTVSVRRKARAPRKDTPAAPPTLPVEARADPRAGSTALENRWVELCRLMHVPHFHDLDARKNVAGLPDGLCVVGDTLFMVEFKPERENERPAQTVWLDALAGVTKLVSGVVRPSDWEAFVNLLWDTHATSGRETDAAVTYIPIDPEPDPHSESHRRVRACELCARNHHPDWTLFPEWAYDIRRVPTADTTPRWDETPAILLIDHRFKLDGSTREHRNRVALCHQHAEMFLGAVTLGTFLALRREARGEPALTEKHPE